jgi:hypothetical protein
MTAKLMKFAFASAVLVVTVSAAAQIPDVRSSKSIRYCCTPQQVNACTAIGGTTTCRTGVCKCQF